MRNFMKWIVANDFENEYRQRKAVCLQDWFRQGIAFRQRENNTQDI